MAREGRGQSPTRPPLGQKPRLEQWADELNCTEMVGTLIRRAGNSAFKALFHLQEVDRRGESRVGDFQGNFGGWLQGSERRDQRPSRAHIESQSEVEEWFAEFILSSEEKRDWQGQALMCPYVRPPCTPD